MNDAPASSDIGHAVGEFDGQPDYSFEELSSAAGAKAGSVNEVAVVETVVAWLQSHGGASGLANACSHLPLSKTSRRLSKARRWLERGAIG